MHPSDFPWLIQLNQNADAQKIAQNQRDTDFKSWFKQQTGRDFVRHCGGGRRTGFRPPIYEDDRGDTWQLVYFPWQRLVRL